MRSLITLAFLTTAVTPALAQETPPVEERFRNYFVRYTDRRSLLERSLNLIKMSNEDVGRSFALIVTVSHYPNFSVGERHLTAAAEDGRKLQEYLERYEFFDEIVVLNNQHVTYDNLKYFLQSYFPARLAKYPKSRFLFAYSGHGMNEGRNGYLVEWRARSLTDKANSINLSAVRTLIDEVVDRGHHVLVLLNACYGGVFLRRSFGGNKYLPRNPGAHAITAGGSRERTWAIPEVGSGSVFFEKLFAGLNGPADGSGDGIVTVHELAEYLRREVQVSTDQQQNPMNGDISRDGSEGEFFFLNRRRQVEARVVAEWRPTRATAMGATSQNALADAREFYKQKRYDEALPLFQVAADAGNAEAMSYIAYMHEDGLGVPKSDAEAARWYERAAALNDLMAINNLGTFYRDGRAVRQDFRRALELFHRAAEAGDPWAMSNLAYMHKDGQGVPASDDMALRWFRAAVDAGGARGMFGLAVMYRDGRGVAQNVTTAAEWFRKSAEAGFHYAMHALGWAYETGAGVPQDYVAAREWYRRGSEEGNVDATYNLAVMYRDGKGGQQDYAVAFRYFEKAAEVGDAQSMGNLGWLYEKGYGVPADLTAAIRWFRAGAAKGDKYSMESLTRLNAR